MYVILDENAEAICDRNDQVIVVEREGFADHIARIMVASRTVLIATVFNLEELMSMASHTGVIH